MHTHKMKVNVVKRNGKPLDTFDVSDDMSIAHFKRMFYSKFHFYPERQRFTVGNASGPVLHEGTFETNSIKDGDTLVFKDLGVQISWRLVFVLEYLGPPVIFLFFYCFPNLFYSVPNPQKSLTQKVATSLVMIHFLKREMESLFVHRFSNATMPIFNLPKNCTHYWILCGVMIGYYVCHPYHTPSFENPVHVYLLALIMLIFEGLNLKTHLILRSLRERGTKTRGIPHGWGYGLVSCANYLWETLAWITFSVLVGCLTSWLFTVVAFVQMAAWAMKKHRNYKKDFKDYPTLRRAIIPFVL